MFTSLSNKLTNIFDKLKSRGLITEDHLNDVMREIRTVLLEADVALSVVKNFIESVKEEALGQKVVKSVTPAQMIIKIINDELEKLLGKEDENSELNLKAAPPVNILMVGLQGSGKTTFSAKLAYHLSKKNKKVLLVSLDVYRPAAQQQLEILAQSINADSLEIVPGEKPLEITKRAQKQATLSGYDVVIYDSAGRLHIDDELMTELEQIKLLTKPNEILLTADAMTGQDAVNIAKAFDEKMNVTGILLSRIDGDTKGGAALSIKYITGKPIKFLGVGEKPSDIQKFDSKRLASRILGMGDIVSLVEKAQEVVNEDEAEKVAKRIAKGKFDLEDYRMQLSTMKKIGGFKGVMSMMPGVANLQKRASESGLNDNNFQKQEVIINSMTRKERKFPVILNASRKKRIAAGSGNSVQDVNKLLQQYAKISKVVKKVSQMKDKQSLMRNIGQFFS